MTMIIVEVAVEVVAMGVMVTANITTKDDHPPS